MTQPNVDAYRQALTAAAVFDRSAAGRVRVTGRDRLDLLHRLSTQDLKALPAGRVASTILTTPIARIVDRIDVLNLSEELLLLTGAGRSTAVRKWLTGYIFFRDEVKLQDVAAERGELVLVGPSAEAVIGAVLPEAGLPSAGEVSVLDDVVVARLTVLGDAGFVVLPPAASLPLWLDRLEAQGATRGDEAAFEQLRVRAGEPAASHELTDAYIPLELDLWGSVSFNKGCYIGQEILARMESRGKLARRLRGLRADAPLSVGAEVRALDDNAVPTGSALGTVTSAADLPDLGAAGLTVLRAAVEPGAAVDAGGVRATVVELPFTA
jgi:aminomethyltransferase